MNLRPEEISSVIKDEIKKYSTEFDVVGCRNGHSGGRRNCPYSWLGESDAGRTVGVPS